MDDVSKFDKETERFTKVGNMKRKRSGHRSIGYGNRILHVGGSGPRQVKKIIYLFRILIIFMFSYFEEWKIWETYFDNVETIEISEHLYKISIDNTKHTRIVCHLGDSIDILPILSLFGD